MHQWLLTAQGCEIGKGTQLPSSLLINWPNQLSIGENCVIQNGVSFDYCYGVPLPGPNIRIGDRTFVGRFCEYNVTSSITIGDNCLIGSGCKFIDHDHGIHLGQPMRTQEGPAAAIVIEDDVWLGVNVVVLKGVKIGRGAVVAAGAVVNRSIPHSEIWGGVPARFLGSRPQ